MQGFCLTDKCPRALSIKIFYFVNETFIKNHSRDDHIGLHITINCGQCFVLILREPYSNGQVKFLKLENIFYNKIPRYLRGRFGNAVP